MIHNKDILLKLYGIHSQDNKLYKRQTYYTGVTNVSLKPRRGDGLSTRGFAFVP